MTATQTRAQRVLKAFHEEELLGKAYDARLVRRLWPYVRPHARVLLVSLALLLLAAGLQLAQPLLIKTAIDRGFLRHDFAVVNLMAIGFFAALIVELVLRVGQLYLMQLSGQRAMNALRSDVFGHLHRLPMRFFDRTPVGRLVTRVTSDVESLNEVFASGAVTAIGDFVVLCGVVAVLLWINWRMALLTFAAMPPLVFVAEAFRRYARQAFREIRVKLARLNSFLGEQVQGMRVVQAFGQARRAEVEFDEINAAYRDANYRSVRYDALLYAVVESVSTIAVAAVLWYAAGRIGRGGAARAEQAISLGSMVVFFQYIKMFFTPIQDLSAKYTVMQSAMAAAERIFKLFDVEERDAPVRAKGPLSGEADVAVEMIDVGFGYKADEPVLSGLTTRIRAGEKIAIVGPTGAGKSTLVALLLRLYEPDHGTIRVGGRDIATIDRESLRARFAVVPQDVFLFQGSLAANVAVGRAPDPDRVRWALEQVGASRLLLREGGLDGGVAERGTNFSLGERQLVAFARALYRDPEMLVLDEATASVDSETEAALERAVGRVLEGRTAIVIAHRLSTIRRADRILVLQHGRLVEEGTHQELLRRGGLYARLYQLQFAQAAAPASVSDHEKPSAC